MGFWGPKTLIKWREPRSVRKARRTVAEKATSPWARPRLVLIYAALLLIPVVVREGADTKWPWAIAVCLVGGLFFVYFVPLMFRWVPSEIDVHEEGVSQQVASSGTNWLYKDIEGFRIVTAHEGKGDVSILVLVIKAQEVPLGIAADVDGDELRATLLKHGVVETTGADDPGPA